MKHANLGYLRILFCMALLLPCMSVQGYKEWHNNLSITEPSAFAPVIDEDLDIQGTNKLDTAVHVAAISSDVLVTVTVDSVVTSSHQLYFYAADNRTITVSLVNDLIFRGTEGDFLITFSGGGDLKFLIAGDTLLSFTQSEIGGAIFLVDMETAANQQPTVTFSRTFPGGVINPNDDATVQIGEESMISFASQFGTGVGAQGNIIFDPTMDVANHGRLILQIDDTGAFIIDGASISTFNDPTLADVNFLTQAGGPAVVSVANTAAGSQWSGLLVVNNNATFRNLMADPFFESNYTTTRVGFIHGNQGVLNVNVGAYFDYVGTVTNYTLTPNMPLSITQGHPTASLIKDRNPSAYIVDGDLTSTTSAVINLLGDSAMYFRSGVDRNGDVQEYAFDPNLGDTVISFTINPAAMETGAAGYGEILFDVEAPLTVLGGSEGQNALQILSLQVTPTGGSIFIDSPSTLYPLRTFNKDANDDYLQYNVGAFMVNNRMNLVNVHLQHTDELHEVFPKNFPEQSYATYLGGERHHLDATAPRPNICLYQSFLDMHTSGAFAGVDLFVPNGDADANVSFISFFSNGRLHDQGTGRSLIMGTQVGGLASDLGTIIDRAAHLDVFQDTVQTNTLAQHQLFIVDSYNNNKVTQGLPALAGDLFGQYSVHSLYLGYESNISIGLNNDGSAFAAGFSYPLFGIAGNFLSFDTQGGDINSPEVSMSTGQGGIFVDLNGSISVLPHRRANMATVVAKSRNGSIDLPKRQIRFAPRIGIAQSNLDLTDPAQRVIIAAGERLSDYTIDWAFVIKDYTASFIPYEPIDTPFPCQVPAIISQNLEGLPVIRGAVDQMQIKNSRLGDQAHIMVDGGVIDELVLLSGTEPGDEAVGLIAMQNNARVGIGSAERATDSLDANITLGINGVELVPNGDATVVLNEDAIISNVCHILTGTLFGLADTQVLKITSDVPREIRVMPDAVLDLSSFDNQNKVIDFGGHVALVMEPGSKLVLGGGVLQFSESARFVIEPITSTDDVAFGSLTSTDAFRVQCIGSGFVRLAGDAQMEVFRNAFFGIESGPITTFISTTSTFESCSNVTTQTWLLSDNSKIYVGSDAQFGGAFQVGNTTDKGGTIDFSLSLDGNGTLVEVNAQGFLGLGVGITSKPEDVAPNSWTVANLFNLRTFTLAQLNGTVRHQQIFDGSNQQAGLLAIAQGPNYIVGVDKLSARILGGGNLALINSSVPVSPTVSATDGVISAALSAGIMSSAPLLFDTSKAGTLSNPATGSELFTYFKVNPVLEQATKLAPIFRNKLGVSTVGYVFNSVINRNDVANVVGFKGQFVGLERSLSIGTVGIAVDSIGNVTAYEVNT